MSKTTKIILLTNGAIIAILLIIGGVFWYKYSQIYVKMGFAEAKFPYRVYSAEEMGKMYPQEPLEGVETTQTPEQTHAKFITALRKGDIDEAVECCVVKSEKELIKKELERIQGIDRYAAMLKDIEIIKATNDKEDENTRIFIYSIEDKGEKFGQSFIFKKNLQGVWLIESF